jgi:hypothetical protein
MAESLAGSMRDGTESDILRSLGVCVAENAGDSGCCLRRVDTGRLDRAIGGERFGHFDIGDDGRRKVAAFAQGTKIHDTVDTGRVRTGVEVQRVEAGVADVVEVGREEAEQEVVVVLRDEALVSGDLDVIAQQDTARLEQLRAEGRLKVLSEAPSEGGKGAEVL